MEIPETVNNIASAITIPLEIRNANIQFFFRCRIASRKDKSNEFTTRVSTSSFFKVFFSFNFSPRKSSVTVISSTSAIGISKAIY